MQMRDRFALMKKQCTNNLPLLSSSRKWSQITCNSVDRYYNLETLSNKEGNKSLELRFGHSGELFRGQKSAEIDYNSTIKVCLVLLMHICQCFLNPQTKHQGCVCLPLSRHDVDMYPMWNESLLR